VYNVIFTYYFYFKPQAKQAFQLNTTSTTGKSSGLKVGPNSNSDAAKLVKLHNERQGFLSFYLSAP